MDLDSLELAANVVFEMCRQHPELCPHHYEWKASIQREDGTKLEYYRCRICGDIHTTGVCLKGERYEQVSEARKPRGQSDDENINRALPVLISPGSPNVESHETYKLVQSLRRL